MITFTWFLVTCNKNHNKSAEEEQIDEVAYSANFNNQLTEANFWFQTHYVWYGAITKQELAAKEQIIEAYITNDLKTKQSELHEVYFKWEKVTLPDHLEFKLTTYLTPAPKKASSKGPIPLETTDPPPSVTPPPPLQ
jgi:hypothetical protein